MQPHRSGSGVATAMHDPSLSKVSWWGAVALAIAIFAVDTFSPLQTAVAVFYVIVILLMAGGSDRRRIIRTTVACVILTLASYAIVHGAAEPGPPLIRLIVSLSAISITS